MKSRAIIPLAVGLLVGILAIKIFADVLKKARGASTANDITKVVCASADINSTAEITSAMVETRMVPKSLAPKGSFADLKDITGRVAAVSVAKGMPITESFLAPRGTAPGMVVRIRDGYRAVAVKVDESSGVAGWLRPGCRVDVVAVIANEGGNNRATISKVILENVEVLAVGQDIGVKGDSAAASVTKSVTLAVLPEEVPRLHLAATKGTLRLAMRNTRDLATGPIGTTTDKDLLGTAGASENKAKDGAGSVASTILSALLTKQPKMSPNKTDKDHEALQVGRAKSAPAANPVQSQPWRVEVLTGAQREEIWFDGSANGARRVDARADGRSRGLGASLSERMMPVISGPAIANPEPVESSGPTESRE